MSEAIQPKAIILQVVAATRFSIVVLPHRFEPVPERLRQFQEQTPGNTLRRHDMCGLALRDRGRQSGAPMRQRLVRAGKTRQHEHVLMLAEPIAQPLRFADPHLDEARPERLDDLELVAVDDHAFAQFVQLLAVGRRPMRRQRSPRSPIAARELVGDVVEGQGVKRPALDRAGGLVERGDEALAHLGIERRLGRPPDVLDAAAQPCDRARGQGQTMLREIVSASSADWASRAPGERTRQIARLVAQAPCRPAEKGSSRRSRARQRFIARRKSCTASASDLAGSSMAARASARMSCATPRNASPTATLGRKAGLVIHMKNIGHS